MCCSIAREILRIEFVNQLRRVVKGSIFLVAARPADMLARMTDKPIFSGATPLTVITNKEKQVAMCGQTGWCLRMPDMVTWRVVGDGVEISFDGKPRGHAPLSALSDFAPCRQIILMSFNGTSRLREHGAAPFVPAARAMRPA